MNGANEFDRAMMRRCIQLARQGEGKTSPNPLVGCVIVQDEMIVGEGFHPKAGEPHAEVFALAQAGEKARDADLYVNLEPCNHFGRTPPCTEAIIKAGIKKVFVGSIDPNPLVSGKGIHRLQSAGIETVVSIEEHLSKELNEGFIHRILYEQPFGILKYAMTLDGKIATTTGHSAWVTSEASRHLVHELRAGCDAIIVGGSTVRQDNPHLTSHGVSDHNPLRVVMSRHLDLPLEAHLWETTKVQTIVFTETKTNVKLKQQLLKHDVEVIDLAEVTPSLVMNNLYERGFCKVLWECGGKLAARAVAEGAVQKVMAFIAPKIIGGKSAPSPVGDLGLQLMTEAIPLERVSVKYLDPDVLIEGYID
ncbi:MAG: Riboflavin biosynthesis protein RibD [Chroococcopsis gigantea SAG 12.99]|jgi:diaminohydroxyphosphoribosylaminopyrimidine deaminase/5-amino-6-(5-phosphoribosylamino)uracil reductase|nr:bifunctional diaminohydroxyphosphoribosylaminopyrimidine deaminase/5-amino-6-(5-phosphoribosylamino)uracil reductase RibD [Chlorogloea purpurea SAG 13.99]MDV3000310.1 Riboflavin biosynthesis protein RibD [Chroococcopsis gigantea SAG 12.99]